MSSNKPDDRLPSVVIYTDGACSGNPGNGGWGAILFYNRADGNIAIKKSLSGGERETTNNKMELSAVINALTALKTACKVELFTDSKYVLEGATKWLNDWLKNGWKTSNKKPVANQNLWQKLIPLLDKHKINWHWVKGHADDELNNEVDALARSEIKKLS